MVSVTVLPFISDQLCQRVLVGFVVLFPLILVALFFYVLCTRHQVLYAPSDFQDEGIFKDLVKSAPKANIIEKIEGEVKESKEQIRKFDVELTPSTIPRPMEIGRGTDQIRKDYINIEALALKRAAVEFRQFVTKGMLLKGNLGDFLADGIFNSNGKLNIIEVKRVIAPYPDKELALGILDKLKMKLENAEIYVDYNLILILALNSEGISDYEKLEFKNVFDEVKQEISFKVKIIVWDLDDLKSDRIVSPA